jgi:ADP-ribosyl-[dinitrogen reductase] hydrolase
MGLKVVSPPHDSEACECSPTGMLQTDHLKDFAMDERNRFRGCLLGLACGDAVGTTAEFTRRGSFPPVTDMVGGGCFQLKPGEWTDDTSMALCLATSLTERGRFDAEDQMQRYWKWVDEGYLSSNGRCFDVGNTVYDALERYRQTGEPFSGSTDPYSAGNGCIMRLAPVPLFFYPDRDQILDFSGQSARTTHGAQECIEACQLFGAMLFQALSGASKEEILLGHGVTDLTSEGLQAIARGDYRAKAEGDIDGSGYVVRSLEAALWCFFHTTSFQEAILRATNLGNDADTTAAVCGQVAGAHYGESGIPGSWLQRLVLREEIATLADQLLAHAPQRS